MTDADQPDFASSLTQEANDRRLAAQVHPDDWTNPTPNGRYNMVVIGAGTAGLVTAAAAAGLGAKVAIIERNLMGGDCLNFGCVPSKALLRTAKLVGEMRTAGGLGVHLPGEASVNFSEVMRRMRRLRADIARHDSAARFRELGIDVYLGQAKFTGPRTIEVGGQSLTFARACIATGTRAAVPDIPGRDAIDYLTNESIFSLTELPPRLAVLGAGAIGCELAQAFARFGSQVTLIETQHGVLPREEHAASQIVRASLEADGVQLLCCGRSIQLAHGEGGINIALESHGSHHEVQVDRLLIATGRTPNIDGLNLEAAGVAYDGRGVTVNDHLRTTNRRVFAAGDICTPYRFTHVADAHARIVVRNALFPFLPLRARVSNLAIPWCTYTDPELARIGRSARELDAASVAHDTFTIPLDQVDRAILDGETDGTLIVHARRGSDAILGATIVARHAGELISHLSLAISKGVGLKGLSSTIFPYPTQAEMLRKAGDAYNRSRLTARAQRILRTLMAWQR